MYYDWITSLTGGSYEWSIVITFALNELLTFVFPSILLSVLDPYLTKYRLDKSAAPKKELLWKAYQEALFLTIVVHPVQIYLLAKALRNVLIFDKSPPSIWYYIAFHFFSYFTNEFFFYWSHRAFHEFPTLYKYHKKHHEFNFTVGIAAQWAHPLEAIICNVLPTFSGPILHILFFGHVHMCHTVVFVGFRLLQTTEGHSGFEFPIGIDYVFLSEWLVEDIGKGVSNHHYFHHSHNTGNYSSPLLDRLMGTDTAYKKYVEAQKAKEKAA